MNAAYCLDETVSGLANRRMSGLGHRLRIAAVVTPFLTRVSGLFEGTAAHFTDKAADRIKSQAIWFRGLSEELLRLDHEIDPDGLTEQLENQRAEIDKVKASVLEMRKALLDLQGMRLGAKLKQSVGRALTYSTDLFDAIESYRWTLLELEANHAKIREGYSATNAADLGAILDRIAAE